MNLDVAENIMDKDLGKSRTLIHKSQRLAKESMQILRDAVYALKGCSKLIKGNGLLGIENRISKLNGKIAYNNVENEGFGLEIVLFILWGK